MDESTRRLRETFGEIAERYAARPGYPPAIVDELLSLTGLTSGSAVLEVGCGTGQLTVPLARRGLAVTAVELSADLAEVALRHLVGHPDVNMIIAAFEDVTLPDAMFDLVVAATSWHWVDPAVGLPKAARVLRPDGALATIYTYHVAGGTEQFFADAERLYERWDASTTPGYPLPAPATAPLDPIDLCSPFFGEPQVRRHEWQLTYTTAEFLAELHTYSPIISLRADHRAELMAAVGSLIDASYGGTVTKNHITELRVVRRV